MESDPIGLEGGLNTYSYVEGNPLTLFDPMGLKCTAFKSEWGDTQYVCDSGSPYAPSWSTGDNSWRTVSFNNERYNQCYSSCMARGDAPANVSAVCLVPGAGIAALTRKEKIGLAASQGCEFAYQSSLCSFECESLEERKSCPLDG